MKSLDRKIKKCDNDATSARAQVKKCYALGNHEAARIHAETSIRHRNQSRHYQMLNARLAPLVDQLKHELTGSALIPFDLNEMQNIIDSVNRCENDSKLDNLQMTQIEISPNDVDSVIQQLSNELALDLSDRLPTIDSSTISHLDIEQRIRNLRR